MLTERNFWTESQMSEQNIRKGQQYCYESISLYGYIKPLKFRENVSLFTNIWLSKNMLFRRKRNARKVAGFILQLGVHHQDWSSPRLESIIFLRVFQIISSSKYKSFSGLLLVLIRLCKELNVNIPSQVYYVLLLMFLPFIFLFYYSNFLISANYYWLIDWLINVIHCIWGHYNFMVF